MKLLKSILLVLTLSICSCSSKTMILEHFNVKKGTILEIPTKHSIGLYPNTNIYITLEPPLKNHPDRDFKDIFNIIAYNKNGEIEEILEIRDINGIGQDIQVVFKNKKPKVKKVKIEFKVNCSGKISIMSWHPV